MKVKRDQGCLYQIPQQRVLVHASYKAKRNRVNAKRDQMKTKTDCVEGSRDQAKEKSN